MHDFGREIGILIWVVLIVIGVVSSIARSARKGQPVNQRTAPSLPRAVVPAPTQQQIVAQRLASVVQQRVVPVPAPPPKTTAPPPVMPPLLQVAPSPGLQSRHTEPVETQRGRAAVLRQTQGDASIPIFDSREALIRGVIAAEVLGKPVALRDDR